MTYLRPQDEDTICALATPPGEGALALVRVSGSQAAYVVQRICPFLKQKQLKSHCVYFGVLKDPFKKRDVDEVLVTYFEKGKSFTGEESLEISCHGGSFLSSLILHLLVKAGARIADRGEFSYRAFILGRIDLVQAESILSLIQSRTPKTHDQALKALQGQVSNYLKKLETDLLRLISHLEASIDFSEQNIQAFSFQDLKQLFLQISEDIHKILEGCAEASINQEGFCVTLSGAPNAGKSSLFNYLLKSEKAIVTKQAGTTRDVLTGRILLNQIEFCIKDMAGLRKCFSSVEREGIQRAYKEVRAGNLNLFLIDSGSAFCLKNIFGLDKHQVEKLVIVFSKADKLDESKRSAVFKKVKSYLKSHNLLIKKFSNLKQLDSQPGKVKQIPQIWLSSKTGEGIRELKKIICKKAEGNHQDIFLISIRQQMHLEKMSEFLKKAKKLFLQKASNELIILELESALVCLYNILGKEYSDEVIQNIFKEFCIGK